MKSASATTPMAWAQMRTNELILKVKIITPLGGGALIDKPDGGIDISDKHPRRALLRGGGGGEMASPR